MPLNHLIPLNTYMNIHASYTRLHIDKCTPLIYTYLLGQNSQTPCSWGSCDDML